MTITAKPALVSYWEASIDGSTVEFAAGHPYSRSVRWTRTFESAERAAAHVAACERAREREGRSKDAALKVLSKPRSLVELPKEIVDAREPSRAVELSLPGSDPPNANLLRAMFRHADAGVIESLRADAERGALDEIVSAIAEEAPASLAEVTIGSAKGYTWRHKWLGNCEPLFDRGLRSLVLYGADFRVGRVDAPRLEHLSILAIYPRRASIEAVLRGNLPSLTTLRMFLGPQDEESDESDESDEQAESMVPTIESLKPLLDGEVLPSVRTLGILNWERADTLCGVLPGSAIAQRLTHLDLTGSQLFDRHIEGLLAAKSSFPALESLDVAECCLTTAGTSSIRAWLPNSRVERQRRSGIAIVE